MFISLYYFSYSVNASCHFFLWPPSAKPVIEVLQGYNLTRFLDLLETAGMTDELMGLNDVTVFAPSNKAIDELPEDVLEEITVGFFPFEEEEGSVLV